MIEWQNRCASRCENCDGTGDVHALDGEWLGRCGCGAEPIEKRIAEAGRELDKYRVRCVHCEQLMGIGEEIYATAKGHACFGCSATPRQPKRKDPP